MGFPFGVWGNPIMVFLSLLLGGEAVLNLVTSYVVGVGKIEDEFVFSYFVFFDFQLFYRQHSNDTACIYSAQHIKVHCFPRFHVPCLLQ